MPKLTISVSSSTSPSLTMIADIHVNTRESPLPKALYDNIEVRPTQPLIVRLGPGDYVMLFDVQNGSGDFTVSVADGAGSVIASHKLRSPPQVNRSCYFTIA